MGNEGRKAHAVFFDLDDTLVLTHAADKKALAAVKLRLASRLPLVDHQAVIDRFVAHFISQPWDPSHQVNLIFFSLSLSHSLHFLSWGYLLKCMVFY